MELTVNGEPQQVAENETIRDLIARLGLGGRAVAVEVNRKLIPKRQHESTRLQPGDQVEVVTLVGGG